MKPSNTSTESATIQAKNGIRKLMSTKQVSNHSDEMFLRLFNMAMYLNDPVKALVIVPLGVTLISLNFFTQFIDLFRMILIMNIFYFHVLH
jgi:hypothetical protein